MSLTLRERTCINCNEYSFDIEQVIGKTVKPTSKRGDFCIKVECEICEASMSFVYFDKHNKWAIAYYHTNNDEPCYNKDCSRCGANTEKSWWVD